MRVLVGICIVSEFARLYDARTIHIVKLYFTCISLIVTLTFSQSLSCVKNSSLSQYILNDNVYNNYDRSNFLTQSDC